MIKKIVDTLSFLKGFQKSHKVFIRGAGVQGRNLKREISELGIRIDAFIDMFPASDYIFGVPIFKPEEIYKLSPESYFIISSIASDIDYYTIRCEMEERGLIEGKHFIDFGIDSDRRMVQEILSVDPIYEDRKKAMYLQAIVNDDILRQQVHGWSREEKTFASEIFIASVDLRVTMYCNLRCKHCFHCISYCTAPSHFDPFAIVEDVDKLLSVAHVAYLAIMGGEAFLHPYFLKIIQLLANLKNINNVDSVYITTNATVLPSHEILTAFCSVKNAHLRISNYADKSKKIKEIAAACAKYKIPCIIYPENQSWIDAGRFDIYRNYNAQELERLLKTCGAAIMCNELHDGKLYSCARIATLNEYGLIPYDNEAFCDIRNIPDEKRGNELYNYLFKTKSFSGCQYCDGYYRGAKRVPKAIQI